MLGGAVGKFMPPLRHGVYDADDIVRVVPPDKPQIVYYFLHLLPRLTQTAVLCHVPALLNCFGTLPLLK